jgi:hypothetical protein
VVRVYQVSDALGGVCVVYSSDAKAFFSIATAKGVKPAELGEDLGPWKFRAHHALRLLLDLLEAAQPDGWRWGTVAVDGVDASPSGIEITANGQTVVLRVTAGGAMAADSNPEGFADYRIPDGVRGARAG